MDKKTKVARKKHHKKAKKSITSLRYR